MLNKIKELYSSENTRSQLMKKNIIQGAGVRGISILTSLLLVPMTIGYISSELYGIWLTLYSVIQWLSFFDIGFGNGLRNKLGEAVALKKFYLGKIYVSSTYFVLSFIFIPLGGMCFFLAPFVNWTEFLNIDVKYNDVLVSTARIIAVSFCVQMILKLIQNVALAYQMSAFSSFLDMIGQVFSLFFIYMLTVTMEPELTNVALVFCFTPLFAFLLASIACYSTIFKAVAPNFLYINTKAVRKVFNLGGEFFVIQVAALILFQMINILISRMSGPEMVTSYNIAYKYLSTALMFVSIILTPSWSAFTDAYVKRDIAWMTNIYKRFIQIFLIVAFVIFICVAVSPWVYMVWIGDKADIPLGITVVVGIYMCIFVWCNFHAYIINGTGKIKFQLYTAVVMMIVFLPMAIGLGNLYGIYGILWAMILVNLPGVFYGRYQVKRLITFTAKGIFDE